MVLDSLLEDEDQSMGELDDQPSGCLLPAVSRWCDNGTGHLVTSGERWRAAAGTAPDESWLQNDLLSMFQESRQLVIRFLE